MAQGTDEPKIRFYKFWQQAQLLEDLSAADAVPIALKRSQDESLPTPDFFRGDVSSIVSIHALDPMNASDLEKAVLAFRDPFYLNRAFVVEKASSEKRKSEHVSPDDAMDMECDDAGPGATREQLVSERIPDIDLQRLKAWYARVDEYSEPPIAKDGEGDTCMDADEKPTYSQRILESFGDLSSALERKLLSKSSTTNKTTPSSANVPDEDLYGYPDIPPSFLESSRGLRFLILILFHPSMPDPDSYNTWHRVLRAFRVLTMEQREMLACWLADEKNIDIGDFQNILQNMQQLITITFLNEFSSPDMPADAQDNPEDIPDQVWDLFTMRAAQKCKNALACIDLLWKANLKRREAIKCWRKAELCKGTASMLNGGSTGPLQALKDEEFFNDALNSVERVLQHEFTYAIYLEHIEQGEDAPLARRLSRRPRKPTSLLEIEFKSMINQHTFGLLAHSCCLNAANKCRFLMFDAASRQREETRQEILNQVMQGHRRVNPYLVLEVKRDNLVQDTLQKITSLRSSEYRKKLRVVFEGEPGIDEGGVRKEFFQLLITQLYDPNYAMFNYNPNNKTYWFNPGSFEANLQYEMFGALLGIAIYNQVILDIRFPLVVYEKLLAEDPDGIIPCSIDNLVEIQPEMAKALIGMLEFAGNVEEVYCRNFVASYECFGAVVEVPLKEGGETIPVTNINRAEYVDLYVDWFFNKSVHDKFRSFKKGFLRCMEVDEEKQVPRTIRSGTGDGSTQDLLNQLLGVAGGSTAGAAVASGAASADGGAEVGGESSTPSAPPDAAVASVPAAAAFSGSAVAMRAAVVRRKKAMKSNLTMFLHLFRPTELELLICGSQLLDFQEYKNNCEYTDGFDASSEQCRWFWEVAIEALDDDERRELLRFVTGSDRAPPKGLGAPEALLTISRQSADSDSLPTAHTCFNHLLIPEYSTKEKLEAKLRLAIQFNQGFGIM